MNTETTQMDNAETRVSRVEKALELDERINRIENKLRPTSGRGWIVWIVGILSALLPVMQWVEGSLKTRHEVALADAMANQAAQKQWLDVVISKEINPEDKQRVLRFLNKIASDSKIRDWAGEELEKTNQDVAALKNARADLAAAKRSIEALSSRTASKEREYAEKLALAEKEKTEAESKINALQRSTDIISPRFLDSYYKCILAGDGDKQLACFHKLGREIEWALNYPTKKTTTAKEQ